MSDDGVGAKAYSHEKMGKLDLFCCCRYMILVVIVEREMIDVDSMKHN